MTTIIRADLARPEHAAALVRLMDEYASGQTGNGIGLSDDAKANLAAVLQARAGAHTLLAEQEGEFVGLLNAFEGFSTFACRPLLNIHDVVVTEAQRGRGIGRLLMEAAERLARELGCCKLTLEVLEGNVKAQAAYKSLGYAGYELKPEMGKALFWQKKLSA
jgi:GNAT superfamily N-acetyltransferase